MPRCALRELVGQTKQFAAPPPLLPRCPCCCRCRRGCRHPTASPSNTVGGSPTVCRLWFSPLSTARRGASPAPPQPTSRVPLPAPLAPQCCCRSIQTEQRTAWRTVAMLVSSLLARRAQQLLLAALLLQRLRLQRRRCLLEEPPSHRCVRCHALAAACSAARCRLASCPVLEGALAGCHRCVHGRQLFAAG